MSTTARPAAPTPPATSAGPAAAPGFFLELQPPPTPNPNRRYSGGGAGADDVRPTWQWRRRNSRCTSTPAHYNIWAAPIRRRTPVHAPRRRAPASANSPRSKPTPPGWTGRPPGRARAAGTFTARSRRRCTTTACSGFSWRGAPALGGRSEAVWRYACSPGSAVRITTTPA
ncbi:unnamed protein product [Urochloa humidicola]